MIQDRLLVSIIIVNWNRGEEIARILRHLDGLEPSFAEIVVVDNGSTDGSVEWLSRLPTIRFVGLPANLGPAKARNIGVRCSAGKYIVFLDSDAMISRAAIKQLVERMESDATIGIAGCRILDPGSRQLDQWIYQYPPATHEYREFDTYSFSAAGAIVRRKALQDAGLFWEDLFIYTEEVDLSIRVLRAGYRVIYLPRARVYHAASNRGRQVPSSYWWLQARNRIWICYRYYNTLDCYRKIIKFCLIYLLKGIYSGHLRACLSGIAAGLAGEGIRGQFPDKLSRDERRRIDSLGRRLSCWLAPAERSDSYPGRYRGPLGRGGESGPTRDTMVLIRKLFGPARRRAL